MDAIQKRILMEVAGLEQVPAGAYNIRANGKSAARSVTANIDIVSKEDGVAMAKAGEIQGVGIAHRKDSEYLKSLPDGTENNNLGNLPSISV